MERYKHLYLWMIIPLVIVQVGIFGFYWTDFTDVKWAIHIHYWAVTFWYLLIVIQPYLATKGKIVTHRTLGIFGFLLAGGVIVSGIVILDIPLKLAAAYDTEKPGPPVAFYYGTLVIEFILMVAFAYAVAKSIIHRHDVKEHAFWLVCSVFYMMAPAHGRGLSLFWRTILPPESFSPIYVFASTELVYIPLLLLFAYKFGKIKHQATLIGLLLVFVRLLRFPIGSSETIQEFLKAIIKW